MHTEEEVKVLLAAIKSLKKYTSRCIIRNSRIEEIKRVIDREKLDTKPFSRDCAEIIICGSLTYIEEIKEKMHNILKDKNKQ